MFYLFPPNACGLPILCPIQTAQAVNEGPFEMVNRGGRDEHKFPRQLLHPIGRQNPS
jgi:hypothetical protein